MIGRLGSIQTGWSGGSSSAAAITERQPGEGIEDWIDRHFDNVANVPPLDTTNLVSAWKCDGDTESVQTTREPGETFRQFFARHRAEAEAAMADCPPE